MLCTNTVIQDVNSAFSPDQSVLNFCINCCTVAAPHTLSPAYAAFASLTHVHESSCWTSKETCETTHSRPHTKPAMPCYHRSRVVGQVILWRLVLNLWSAQQTVRTLDWRMEQGLMSHSTQNRSFRRRSSQPISWLGAEKPNPTKQSDLNYR